MALTYRFRRDWWSGKPTDEVVITSDGVCDGPHWHGAEPAATLAHAGFEIVAQVLAAPLRRAFEDHWHRPHLDAADPEFPVYRAHCAECKRLEAMLPEGDRPIAMA